MTTFFTTENPVRVMFCNFKKPRKQMGGSEKYGCLILFHKDSEEFAALRSIIKTAMVEEWGSVAKLGGRFNPVKQCAKADLARVEEGKAPLFDKLEDADDYYFINANNVDKPGFVDEDLKALIDLSCFRSGCYVRVNVNAYPWDHGGKGVSIGLNHVQFVKDGPSLSTGGGGGTAAEAFGGLGGKVADAASQEVDDLFG